jgi:hypothetical protein
MSSNSWPQVSTLFGNWSRNTRAFHFSLGVDDDTSVIFATNEDPVSPSPSFALSNNDSGHDFFPELGLSFLHCHQDHVSDGRSWQTIETSSEASHGHDVQNLRTCVVSAVDSSTYRKS